MPVTVIALLKDPNLVQTTYAEYWRKRVAREKFLGFTLVCPDLRIPENHGRRAYRSASGIIFEIDETLSPMVSHDPRLRGLLFSHLLPLDVYPLLGDCYEELTLRLRGRIFAQQVD